MTSPDYMRYDVRKRTGSDDKGQHWHESPRGIVHTASQIYKDLNQVPVTLFLCKWKSFVYFVVICNEKDGLRHAVLTFSRKNYLYNLVNSSDKGTPPIADKQQKIALYPRGHIFLYSDHRHGVTF